MEGIYIIEYMVGIYMINIPDMRSVSIIVHKRIPGNKLDPSNYRDMSLIHAIMYKIFSIALTIG